MLWRKNWCNLRYVASCITVTQQSKYLAFWCSCKIFVATKILMGEAVLFIFECLFGCDFLVIKNCSRTFLVYLFLRFSGISYRRFIAIHYKFKLSTYVQEPLVIGRRGLHTEILKQGNGWQQIMDTSSPVWKKSFMSIMWGSASEVTVVF